MLRFRVRGLFVKRMVFSAREARILKETRRTRYCERVFASSEHTGSEEEAGSRTRVKWNSGVEHKGATEPISGIAV